MAIVNRTPDSFYDRGATFTDAAAMDAVARAVDDGADLVDIGGVKAGPGASVDVVEETSRVVPFVAAIRENYPDLLISVDTWRAAVARDAVAAGADLVNDTWAGADPDLVAVAAELGAGIVCSHTGGAWCGRARTGSATTTWSPTSSMSWSPPPKKLRQWACREARFLSIRLMISEKIRSTGSPCCGTWTFLLTPDGPS